MLAVSGTLAAAALVASAVVPSPSHRLILQGFAAAVVAEAVYGYALVCTRVRTTLKRYATLEAVTAAIHLTLGVALAWSFGLAGAFAALAISSLAGAAIASRWVDVRPSFDRGRASADARGRHAGGADRCGRHAAQHRRPVGRRRMGRRGAARLLRVRRGARQRRRRVRARHPHGGLPRGLRRGAERGRRRRRCGATSSGRSCPSRRWSLHCSVRRASSSGRSWR